MSQKSQIRLLYRQEQLPVLQNRIYDTKAEAISCPKGDVVLVEDQETGLIYNEAFQPELVVYDDHYQNEQAGSPLFRQHLKSVSEIVDRCIGRKSLVEVGCGKGFFLEMLLKKLLLRRGYTAVLGACFLASWSCSLFCAVVLMMSSKPPISYGAIIPV